MATLTTIAIIGATGNMGAAITRSLRNAPCRLLLLGGNEERLHQLLIVTGEDRIAEMEVLRCTVDACWEADIIITAVPHHAEKAVAKSIRAVATGKIVVSISNPRGEYYEASDKNVSAAEALQQLLPHSKVVKAFNTISASDFLRDFDLRKKTDVLIAGDDEASVSEVCRLVDYTGFHPVKAGRLSESRHLENMHAITTW